MLQHRFIKGEVDMDLMEKLQKLSELSKRGIGGEKENAELLLKKLMKKYHITEEDLQLKIKNWYKFHVDSELESKLLFQTAYMVCGHKNETAYRKKTKRIYFLKLTAEQKIEIEYIFSIFKEDLSKELDSFYTAFIYKNNIFPEDVPRSENDNSDISEIFKIQGYMSNIKKSNVRKAIGLSENE